MRKQLGEMGYPDRSYKEEVEIELYPGSRGYADFIIEEQRLPLILVETKSTPNKAHEGFLQARAYAILHNPERPIPYHG